VQFSTWNLYLRYQIRGRHNKGTLQRSTATVKSRTCKIWYRDKSHFPKITIRNSYSLVHTETEQFACFRSQDGRENISYLLQIYVTMYVSWNMNASIYIYMHKEMFTILKIDLLYKIYYLFFSIYVHQIRKNYKI